jgi:hypothetical protein
MLFNFSGHMEMFACYVPADLTIPLPTCLGFALRSMVHNWFCVLLLARLRS